MGYLNLRPERTNIFFKLMEERYRRPATMITTNLEYDEGHNFLGNNALVDALLSRLRPQCHTVRIKWAIAPRVAGLGMTTSASDVERALAARGPLSLFARMSANAVVYASATSAGDVAIGASLERGTSSGRK